MAGPRSRITDWDDMALPLPTVTASRISSTNRRPLDGDNVGLWLDKLVFRNSRRDWSLKANDRSFALSQFCRKWAALDGAAVYGVRGTGAGLSDGAAALHRMKETVKALHPHGERLGLRATVDGRLLVDYGRANSVESSISFHAIWGVPRIPASALKGVTRAHLRLAGAPIADVENLFGTQKETGRVVFYDAIPVDGKFEMALDVLTPHHREYYEGREPPADWEDPIPHTFLTVVATTFEFWLGARSDAERDREALARAHSALKEALQETGIGAKTASGYGRFTGICEVTA